MSDGMHKMCFSKPYASIDKKRIVHGARRFCDGKRSGVCKVVIAANDKSIESILWI